MTTQSTEALPILRIKSDGKFPPYSSTPFKPDFFLSYQDYSDIFDFAYNMAFGDSIESGKKSKSKHRATRSGGSDRRSQKDIFLSAFEGKIGEVCVYRKLLNHFTDVSAPDFDIYSRGQWDGGDLTCHGLNISIKTSLSYSQLLLLEFNDYGSSQGKAFYRHSPESQDIIVMCRISKAIMDRVRDSINAGTLVDDKDAIYQSLSNYYLAELSGYIGNKDLNHLIENNIVVHQGVMLKGKMPMDATNYYVFIKNMRSFESMIRNINRRINL